MFTILLLTHALTHLRKAALEMNALGRMLLTADHRQPGAMSGPACAGKDLIRVRVKVRIRIKVGFRVRVSVRIRVRVRVRLRLG